jgi:hypothetical protein
MRFLEGCVQIIEAESEVGGCGDRDGFAGNRRRDDAHEQEGKNDERAHGEGFRAAELPLASAT